ncbi:hypothetical protein ALISP_0033 [Alicycliphilus sp. B1]|nr:hypothetical protein ALISP_0033 [Alicycliphilus sp. B1]
MARPVLSHSGEQLALFGGCQRWRLGQERYRPAGEPFDPGRYGAEPIGFAKARCFVVDHHYSATMPVARLQIGLLHKASACRPETLAGVLVFSVPVQEQAVPAWLGLPPRLGIEIGRLVLLDAVPGNGESWFLGRCFRLLRQLLPEVRGVLSYCDPLERRDAQGRVVKRGHIGTVYKAFNGRYAGRSAARTLLLAPDGRSVNERTLSKIRRGEQGAGYAVRQLQALGAPAPFPGEDGSAYVTRALDEGGFRKLRHPGNLTFTWSGRGGRLVS